MGDFCGDAERWKWTENVRKSEAVALTVKLAKIDPDNTEEPLLGKKDLYLLSGDTLFWIGWADFFLQKVRKLVFGRLSLLGNKCYTIGNPVYILFICCHVWKENAFARSAAEGYHGLHPWETSQIFSTNFILIAAQIEGHSFWWRQCNGVEEDLPHWKNKVNILLSLEAILVHRETEMKFCNW